MTLLVLDAEVVSTIEAGLSVSQIEQCVADSLSLLSATSSEKESELDIPHRISLQTPDYTSLIMPSHLPLPVPTSSIKIVSLPSTGSSLSGIPSTLLLISPTGIARAIINGGTLTALRTAAASALATKICIPDPPPPDLHMSVFGSGLQALYHSIHLPRSIPSITTVHIFVRSVQSERLSSLLKTLDQRSPRLSVKTYSIDDLEISDSEASLALKMSRVVCTCTPSKEPFLKVENLGLNIRDRKVHLNLLGSYRKDMAELDPSILSQSQPWTLGQEILVDTRDGCEKEFGEFLALDVDERPRLRELGEALLGKTSVSNVSVYKSVGTAVMDGAILRLIVDEAEKRGLGQQVNF